MPTQTVSTNYVVEFFLNHATNLSLETGIGCFNHKILVGRHSPAAPDIVSLGFHFDNLNASAKVLDSRYIYGAGDIGDVYYIASTHTVNPDFVIFKVTSDGTLHEFRRTREGNYIYTCSLLHEWTGKRLEWIAQQCHDEEAYNLLMGALRESVKL